MGMHIDRSFSGTTDGAGVVKLHYTALPDHLRYANTAIENVLTEDTPFKSVAVQIAGTATVTLQGTNGDPDTAGEWFDLSSTSSSALLSSTIPTRFIRANVTSHTSGDVDVQLTVSE